MSIYQRIIIIIFSLFCFSAFAQSTAANAADAPLGKSIKPYHSQVMPADSDESCETCHNTKKPIAAPLNDDNCLTCHGTPEEVAAQTEPPATTDHPQPNPHNSIHYGTDVPCSVCHSEHKKSELYCNNCHMFEFPNMKP